MTIQHTPNYNLPYPQLADTPDVPRDIGALAQAIDTNIKNQATTDTPVGSVMMWMTPTAPTGWVFLKGASASCLGANNPGLKTLFGVNASDQVLLPDCRNTFLVGAGSNYIVGATQDSGGKSGAEAVALNNVNQLPAHNHSVTDPGHNHPIATAGNHGHNLNIANASVVDPQHVFAVAGGVTHILWSANLGSGDAPLSTADAWRGEQGNHGHIGSTAVAAGDHNHTLTAASTGITTQDAGSGATHENRPPFLAINMIMKMG